MGILDQTVTGTQRILRVKISQLISETFQNGMKLKLAPPMTTALLSTNSNSNVKMWTTKKATNAQISWPNMLPLNLSGSMETITKEPPTLMTKPLRQNKQ